jgi:hypothetical protein
MPITNPQSIWLPQTDPAVHPTKTQILLLQWTYTLAPHSFRAFSAASSKQFASPSIVEGRSDDGTYEILHSLAPELAALNITYHFTTNDIDPKAGNGVDLVEALAILRNQALHPLSSSPENFSPDTTVLFINDVALCVEGILELIH